MRFYWDKDGFDGIAVGEFKTKLQPWEIALLEKCLEAIIPARDGSDWS